MRLPVREAMSDLLNAVDVEMRHDTAIQFLAPGAQVAWDNCCEDGSGSSGGQLWVRAVNVYPGFPRQENDLKCAPRLYTAVLEVGVVRCAHTLDDQGNPPTEQEMTEDTTRIMEDMEDMLSGMNENFDWAHIVGQWVPVGPDGGCAGGQWSVSVRLQPCQ